MSLLLIKLHHSEVESMSEEVFSIVVDVEYHLYMLECHCVISPSV